MVSVSSGVTHDEFESEVSACIYLHSGVNALQRLLDSAAPHVAEIIVVHNGEIENLEECIKSNTSTPIRVLVQSWPGAIAAREIFFNLVSYPYMLMLDDDEILPISIWRYLPMYVDLLKRTQYVTVRHLRYRYLQQAESLQELETFAHDPENKTLIPCRYPRDTLIQWDISRAGVGWKCVDQAPECQSLDIPDEQVFLVKDPVIVWPYTEHDRHEEYPSSGVKMPVAPIDSQPVRPSTQQFSPRLAVSLLIHESLDVIEEQLNNFVYYLDKPLIIIHIARDFAVQSGDDFGRLERIPGVHINPEHIETAWAQTGLTLAHASNFKYALRCGEFDYLIMNASNDMYVRKGAGNYIRQFEAGFQRDPLPINDSVFSRGARRDQGLWQLRKHLGGVPAYVAGHEGSFYSRTLIEKMAPLIERFAQYDIRPWLGMGDPNGDYGKEEYYFATTAAALTSSIGWPIIYRDYANQPSLPHEAVEAVLQGRAEDLEFYVGGEPFGVKRVARTMNDPTRIFIRSLLQTQQV